MVRQIGIRQTTASKQHLLLIVCGDVKSNLGPISDKRVRFLYSNIRGLRANLDKLAVARLNDDVLVSAESKVSDRHHLSELHIPGFGCPQQRLRNSTPGAPGMALFVREGFCSIRQSKLECSHHESCVFCICSRISNFYVYAFYCNPGYDCLLDSMAWSQSVDDKEVFSLMRMIISLSGWSWSLLLISMGVMLLIFAICQVVSCWYAVPLTLLVTDSI